MIPHLAIGVLLAAAILGGSARAEEAATGRPATEAAEATALARTPSPPGARVYFISPAPGEAVTSPVLVRFGLQNMGVAPATVAFANTGHHHMLVDTPLPPFDRPIPADAKHIHFGAGQTEISLELPPGKHTLQLILGDQNHVPHDPPVYSEPLEITVQ